jgi:cytochrome c peroxidase
VRSILSGNAPFDRFVNGDRTALSPEQQRGLAVFRGKANCTACHIGPTLSDERFHNTGVAWHEPPPGSATAGSFADEGRFAITRNASDRGAFKTATLREIARTAPYMHDGSIATLSDVVDFYERGGRANPFLDPEVRPLTLTGPDKRALVAFLRTLSGTMTR